MTNKTILFLSLIGCIVLLVFGIADPNSPAVWLASTSSAFAWLRAGMIAILFGLLVTNPPRNLYFRLFVGVVSIGMAAWAMGAVYNNSMQLLDGLMILEFSICAGLTALEYNYEEVMAEVNQSSKKRAAKSAKTKLATA